jgi:hypothetical protein
LTWAEIELLTSVSDPALSQDAATKKYVDDTIAAGARYVWNILQGIMVQLIRLALLTPSASIISIEAYDHMDPSQDH